jgi:hypothetical protein
MIKFKIQMHLKGKLKYAYLIKHMGDKLFLCKMLGRNLMKQLNTGK